MKADLKTLAYRLQDVADLQSAGEETGDWEFAYDAVFSERVSRRIRSLMAALGLEFDAYYDPDTSYEEDVRAYADACASLKVRVDALLRSLP